MKSEAARWLVIIVAVAAAAGGFYYYQQQTRPCVEPIRYSIGSVDSRFGESDVALLATAKAAAAIWNKAEGRQILAYDPAGALTINLVYDSREANAQLGLRITEQQAKVEAARTALASEQAQFASAQAVYNQKVSEINARGGATRREAAALTAERQSLKALATSINDQIAAFNASVASFNALVKQYNQTAGHTFEEGNYERDSSGERINVFEFIGDAQLERVLAHEFGHAIGLDHNTDPDAIMYAQNESGNLVPTAADLAALRAICGS